MKRRVILASTVAALTAAFGVAAVGGLARAAPALPGVRAQPAQVPVGSGYGPAAVLAGMSEQQQVGQLFMAGVPATGPVSSAISTDITTYHTGSVILTGRSSAGVAATAQLTSALQDLATSAATDSVPLLIATDQEGGNVQVLSGPGFSTMPTALSQGAEPTGELLLNANVWGGQLAAAGVNLNLAPVLDTVPASDADTNQPIGIYQREYGYTPAAVTAAGTEFLQGMQDGGVSVAIKHFPGLGRASGNTDTTYGVTDDVTTYNDPYLQPYTSAVQSDGVGVVMVSEAIYTQIDAAHQAVFSPTVLGGMLRDELGFHGVIMSDSMEAAAVSELTPAEQAVDFIDAGGDLVLATDPTVIPAMYNAVLAQAQTDPSFATLVSQAALTVLTAKQQAGLIGGTVAVAGSSSGQLTIIERSSGDSLAAFTQSGGSWTGPVALGGLTNYEPAAASIPGTATVEAAVIGLDGSTWVLPVSDGAPSGAWTSIGGIATAPPAIAAGAGGQLAVVVRGLDQSVWYRTYTPATGWGAWAGIGGLAADAPIGATYTASGDLDVFVTGLNDTLWENTLQAGAWAGWQSLGGVVIGGPAVVTVPGGPVQLFVRSTGGAVAERTYSGGSSAWTNLGGMVTTSPSAASEGGGTSLVVAQGLNGDLYQNTYNGSTWSGWQLLPAG
jgi:beta-N-acetylhexosaminidase